MKDFGVDLLQGQRFFCVPQC